MYVGNLDKSSSTAAKCLINESCCLCYVGGLYCCLLLHKLEIKIFMLLQYNQSQCQRDYTQSKILDKLQNKKKKGKKKKEMSTIKTLEMVKVFNAPKKILDTFLCYFNFSYFFCSDLRGWHPGQQLLFQ